MARRALPPTASDDEVRALLDRYRCPVPFHAVRTRFLGSIASPGPDASPIKVVEALWGGALPTFNSLDAANELIGALVMGLWNRLTRHQERSVPFRLTRQDTPASREGLAVLARLRREELEGFITGFMAIMKALTCRSGRTRHWMCLPNCAPWWKPPRSWPTTRASPRSQAR